MNKVEGAALNACIELTEEEEGTFLRVEYRPGELFLQYLKDGEIPTTIGKAKIENGELKSDYGSYGIYEIPQHHWNFMKYLKKKVSEKIAK